MMEVTPFSKGVMNNEPINLQDRLYLQFSPLEQ